MLSQEIGHQDFRSVGDAFATTANGGQELSFLLATQEVRAALARVQEHADIEAQDVFAQADEALVLQQFAMFLTHTGSLTHGSYFERPA